MRVRIALAALVWLFPALSVAQGQLGVQGDITAVRAGNGLVGGAEVGIAAVSVACAPGSGLVCNADDISIDSGVIPNGNGSTNYYSKWIDANTLGIGNLFDDGGSVIVRGGTGSLATVGGIHMYFTADEGFIYSATPGTANRKLTLGGYPVIVNVNGGTAMTFNPTYNDITNPVQLTERLRFSGQEFYQAANTSTDGPTFLLGVNRGNNRQVWLADSANLTQNSTNMTLRFGVFNSGAQASVTALATDGVTYKTLNVEGSSVNIVGNPIKVNQTAMFYNNVLFGLPDADANAQNFAVNYYGYAPGGVPGTTRDRDFSVYNGKGQNICYWTGSTLAMSCAGSVAAVSFVENGVPVLAGTITDYVLPMGLSGNLTNSPISYNNINTITSTAQAFTIAAGAGLGPSFVMGQTGQTTWQFYEPASANTFHIWNSVNGDVATWTTNDLTLAGDLSVQGSTFLARGSASGGAVQIQGTTFASHFSYDTAEDTYIRGGKAASSVIIGDVNTGPIYIGNAASGSPVDINNQTTKFGATIDGGTFIAGESISFQYGTDADADGYINWRGYQDGTSRFRNLIFGTGKQVEACRLTGSTSVMNCVGFTENSSPVLSGTISDDTFPVGNASGNLENSLVTQYGTGGVRVAQASGVAEFTVGDATGSTGASDVYWNMLTYTDGNIYSDFKVASNGFVYLRAGHGTQSSAQTTWLTYKADTATIGLLDLTPTNVLTVAGNISTINGGGFWVNEARNAGMYELDLGAGGTGGVTFRTGNTDHRMHIDNAGKIILNPAAGTTSATQLGVRIASSGSLYAADSWANAGWMTIGQNVHNASGASSAALGIGYSSALDASIFTSVAPSVAWKGMLFSASNYNFYITGNGSIYTSMTVGALNQVSTAQSNVFVRGDSDSTGSDAAYTGYTIQRGSGPTELWFIGRDGTNNTDALIVRRAAAVNEMVIDTNGDIGVGMGTDTNPVALLQIDNSVVDPGSYSISTWNSEERIPLYVITEDTNGGSTPASTQPALVLARQGVSGQAYGNFVEFKVGRYQNVYVDSRTRLDIALTSGIGEATGTNIMSYFGRGAPSVAGALTVSAHAWLNYTQNYGIFNSAGGLSTGQYQDVANTIYSGKIRRNWVEYSSNLGNDSGAFTADDGWYEVEYPDNITSAEAIILSPRGVREGVRALSCVDSSCSADYRTNLTYTSTGIKDLRERTVTASVWVRTASGTNNISMSLGRYADNDQVGTNCSISTTWTRCVFTRTFSTGNYADNSVVIWYINDLDTTVFYLWGAQLEEGTQATPYEANDWEGQNNGGGIRTVADSGLDGGGYATSDVHADIKVVARQSGTGGNNYTIQFVADGSGAGSLTDGTNAVFHYQTGVTTVANLCTALDASVYMQCGPTAAGTISSKISAGTFTFAGAEDGRYMWANRAAFGGTAQEPLVVAAHTVESSCPTHKVVDAALFVGKPSWGTINPPSPIEVICGAPEGLGADYPSVSNASGGIGTAEQFALTVRGQSNLVGVTNVTNLGTAPALVAYRQYDHTTNSGSRTAAYIYNLDDDSSFTNTTNTALILEAANADNNIALKINSGTVDFSTSTMSLNVLNITKADGGGPALTVTHANPANPYDSIRLFSGNATAHTAYVIGRTAVDGYWAVAGAGGHYLSSSVAGDTMIFQAAGTLHLGSQGISTASTLRLGIDGTATFNGNTSQGFYWMLRDFDTNTEDGATVGARFISRDYTMAVWTGGFVVGAYTNGATPAECSANGRLCVQSSAHVFGGQMVLGNGTSNFLTWANVGVAAPSFTTRSAGTKLILWQQVDGDEVDYAIGIESGTQWYSVPTAGSGNFFKWYGGTTNIMSLRADGLLTVPAFVGTTISASASGGSLDDWAPTGLAGASTIRLNLTGATTLTGITGGTAGRQLRICVTGGFPLQINHDVTSSAANRIRLPGLTQWTTSASTGTPCFDLNYDGTDSVWRLASWSDVNVPQWIVGGNTITTGTARIDGAISDNNSDVQVNDGFNVTGNTDLDGTLNVDGNATTASLNGYTILRKTTSQDDTDTTLSDDTVLQFTTEANGAYIIEGMLLLAANGAAVDSKFAMAVAAGTMTIRGHWSVLNSSNAVDNGGWAQTGVAVSATPTAGSTADLDQASPAKFFAVVETTNATTFKVQFAANAAGTARMNAGSYLHYRKIN